MASFKKRTLKGNVRRGDKLGYDEGDEEDDRNNLETVSEIKLEQKMRQKKLGAEFSTDGPTTGSLAAPSTKTESTRRKGDDPSTFGSQFESRMDAGLSAGKIAHEKIMQEYINERLGLKDSDNAAPDIKKSKLVSTEEDELYKVPEELKVMGTTSVAAGQSASGKGGDSLASLDAGASGTEDASMLDWSLGLAEVALPMSFRMKNIEETEKARRKFDDNRMADRATKYGIKAMSSSLETIDAALTASAAASSSSSSSLLAAARFWPAHLQLKKNEEREKQRVEIVDVLQGPTPETAPTVSAQEFRIPGVDGDNRNQHEFQRSGGGGRGGGGRGGRGGRNFSHDDFVFNKFKKASFR